MEMEPDVISQTALDQLVCSEQSQMLKALIPYTSSGKSAVSCIVCQAYGIPEYSCTVSWRAK